MRAEALRGKRVAVVGMGLTGVASAKKLVQLGARVEAFDNADTDAVRHAARRLRELGVRTTIGEILKSDLADKDLVVVSPGVPPTSPSMDAAAAAGVEVISEIELASRVCGGQIVAVTGTNGKTTTATLIGELLKAGGRDTVVAGNIAPAFVSVVKHDDADTVYVIEVSSFQLATISTFRPHVAVLLNITPDHLNWHGTMDEYVACKARVFENQAADDLAVLNFDDEKVRSVAEGLGATIVGFSKRPREADICLSEGWIVDRRAGGEEGILAAGDLRIPGAHNVENALAATAAALSLGVERDAIAQALAAFEGVEHRLEKVSTVNGVTYWNDSKATNPDAAIKALEAFDEPVIVLLGGRNKGNPFDELATHAASRAKLSVAFGEAGGQIELALERAGARHERAGSMADALRVAGAHATSGDNVVLSPACASFDEFDSFGHRGTVFKKLVARIGGGGR